MIFAAAQREVMSWAELKGWEPNPDRSFSDACALLHSEVSEALDAYRIRGFDYYTAPDGKPDDVASELADVLIRLLHYSSAYGVRIHTNWTVSNDRPTFGGECMYLHDAIGRAHHAFLSSNRMLMEASFSRLYAQLCGISVRHGVDLWAEYHRKMTYNYTREYRHGGRLM